jgi:hypothetical protein
MVGGQKRASRLVEQVVEVDPHVELSELLGLVGGGGHDRDFELPGAEHRHRLLRLRLEHRQLDVGVARDERRHGGWHERGAGGRKRRHPHPATPQPGDRLQFALGEGLLGEDHVGMTEERLAGVREADAAAGPRLLPARDEPAHRDAMSPARTRLVGINHVALEVGDLEEALEFYGAIFELRGIDREPGMAFIDMGDQFIALSQGRAQTRDERRD